MVGGGGSLVSRGAKTLGGAALDRVIDETVLSQKTAGDRLAEALTGPTPGMAIGKALVGGALGKIGDVARQAVDYSVGGAKQRIGERARERGVAVPAWARAEGDVGDGATTGTTSLSQAPQAAVPSSSWASMRNNLSPDLVGLVETEARINGMTPDQMYDDSAIMARKAGKDPEVAFRDLVALLARMKSARGQ